MTIGEVSEKYGLSPDTLRYYEKIGLLKKIHKVNGRRDYTADDEKTLNFIICMKNAGFNLDGIIKFLDLYEMGDDTLSQRIDMLLLQKKKLADEIKEKEKTMEFLNYKIDFYEKKRG